jgi:type VI secretion system secreted protein VgrG
MHDDQPMPVTLAIADCRTDLRVLGFQGQEGLNEVYRYDIDLVGTDPHLDLASWSGRDAFLSFGPPGCGVHGRVSEAVQRYAGTCLSHYRLSLMPSLHLLGQRSQRRVHSQLTAPALIARLLEEHDIDAGGYRFDALVGLYPVQAIRVQYDETDLHFLQRVCEEEGIHFHFEHSRERHHLVFADDPASFAEHSSPLRFDHDGDGPALRHLAQHWLTTRAEPCVPMHVPGPESADTPALPGLDQAVAINDVIDEPAGLHPADIGQGLRRQRAIRDLQRLRCGRQRVRGASNRTDVHSGHIVQVLGHPEARLNDHWLITRIEHSATRLDLLEGCDPHDIAAIVGNAQALALKRDITDPPQGYRNTFDAVPWTMTYRPALRHLRPRVRGEQCATVMDSRPDEHGRLPIRFDWQPVRFDDAPTGAWPLAYVLRGADTGLAQLLPGSHVFVAHFDGDPERPVICGVAPEPAPPNALDIRLDGVPVDVPRICVQPGQRLHVRGHTSIALRGAQATVDMDPQGIALRGSRVMRVCAPVENTGSAWAGPDLRLTRKPGLRGGPLADCVWYIVRMPRPGLEHLPRIDPRHILFEGTSDAQGYLGLGVVLRRLRAAFYNAEPHALCLAYPGHCVALHAWFEQNWTEQQRHAFRLSGL